MWKPVVCGAPGSAEGRRLCPSGKMGPPKPTQLILAGQEPRPSSSLTGLPPKPLSWDCELLNWNMTKRKTEIPVELNYIYRERQGSEGREGRGKRGGERVKQMRQVEGCSLSFM